MVNLRERVGLWLVLCVFLCLVLSGSAREARAQGTEPPNWTQLNPATAGVEQAAMAYDAKTNNVVLFGGLNSSGSLNETWIWNGTTWTQVSPANSPSARYGAAMAYDAKTGNVVLFGGQDSSNNFLNNDTWTWDGTTWTQQPAQASGPKAPGGDTMVYDSKTGNVVLLTGDSSGSATWTWDGTTWTQLSPATSPPFFTIVGASMAYDAKNGNVVLFGTTLVPNNPLVPATWTWDGTTWTQQSPATSPPATAFASMAYDAQIGQVVLFGGQDAVNSGLLDNTWTWNGTTWTQLSPATSPPARMLAAMASDPMNSGVLLVGGLSANSTLFDDTWALETEESNTGTAYAGATNLGTANVCPAGATAPAPCSQSATVSFKIPANTTIGSIKILAEGETGLDFQATSPDSSTTLCSAKTYSAQTTCTVDVTFTPKYPGLRRGAVVLTDSSGAVIATAYVYGTGKGPEAAFVPGTISTVAGDGTGGSSGDGGMATKAELYFPQGVAVDGAGNLYIADTFNSRIREVNAAGNIHTVAGDATVGYSGDGGLATKAELAGPGGVAVDGAGNLYIADTYNNRIREVNAATGIITTVAGDGAGGYGGDGGPAEEAELYFPQGVAVDGAGNLYIADTMNNRIREVNAATGIITTVAGDTSAIIFNGNGGSPTGAELGDGGPATQAALWDPSGVAVDGAGNLYIADEGYDRIREVNAATGIITTVAGGGSGGSSGDGGAATSAKLKLPRDVAVDGAGNLYIADQANDRIREVNAATGIITTVAGNGTQGYSGDSGPATNAELYYPWGVAVDGAGNLYIADTQNFVIRKVDVQTPPSLSFATTNVGATSSDSPQSVTIQNIGNGTLTFPIPRAAGTYNPSVPSNFSYDNSSTCTQNGAIESTAFTLASGASCTAAIDFTPQTAGTDSGSAVLTDDSLNAASPDYAAQSIKLSGTANAVAPDPPTNLTATPGDTQATISFTPPTFTGGVSITSYTAKSSPGGLTGTCTASPCTVTGLTNFTSYTFTMTATNSAGTSVASSPSNSVTPEQTQTITFANPGAQIYGTQATLTATSSSTLTVTFTSETPATCTVTSAGVLSPIGVGTCTIDADQSGSSTYLAAQVSQSFPVNPATLTVTVNSATRVYGTVNPAFTGTVLQSDLVSGDTIASIGLVYGTDATTGSDAGTYPITATITSANYTLNLTPGTLTVTQAASATTLAVSSASVNPNQSVTLTATVTDAAAGSTGTPTSTVSFYDGSSQLGTGTLSGGVATLSTTLLNAGATNAITAVYGGDTNFTSSSTTASVSVVVAPLKFAFTTVLSSAGPISAGGTATFHFTLTPLYGSYPAAVNFATSNLPPGATATFSPATVAANGGTQTITLTVKTSAQSAMAQPASSIGRKLAPLSLAFLLLPFFGLGRTRRRLSRLLCVLLLVGGMAAAVSISGCGGSSGIGHYYPITVTATSGTMQQQATTVLVTK